MKLIVAFFLAGSGTDVIASPVFSSTTRSNDENPTTRIITKTIFKTTVRSIVSHQNHQGDGTPREDRCAQFQDSAVIAEGEMLLSHPNDLRDIHDPPHNTSALPTIAQRPDSGTPFLYPPTMHHSARAVTDPTGSRSTKPQRPPTGVPTIPSERLTNLRRADSHDQAAKQPEYWPIMIYLNGYDVEIPILRDNATTFCEAVMKKKGREKGEGKTSGLASTKRISGKVVPTDTSEDGNGSETAAATTTKTLKDTDDVVLSTSEAKSSRKSNEASGTSTSTSETADETFTEDSGSSMATPTGKKPASAKATTMPTLILTSDLRMGAGTIEDNIDTYMSTISTPTPAATTFDSDVVSSDEVTPTPSKMSNQNSNLPESSKAWKEDMNTTANKRIKNMSTTEESFIQHTSMSTADTPSFPTAGSTSESGSMKLKKKSGLLSVADKVVPWYRAPFVWRKKGVTSGDENEEENNNESQVEHAQGDGTEEAGEEDRGGKGKHIAKPTAKTSTYEDDSSTSTASPETKPTKTSALTHADTNAANEEEKPTFGIHHSSSAADPTSTSDASDETEDEESSSSSKKAMTSAKDDATSPSKARPDKTAEPTDSGIHLPIRKLPHLD